MTAKRKYWTDRQRDEIAVMILRTRSATKLILDVEAEYGCSHRSAQRIVFSVKKMLTED